MRNEIDETAELVSDIENSDAPGQYFQILRRQDGTFYYNTNLTDDELAALIYEILTSEAELTERFEELEKEVEESNLVGTGEPLAAFVSDIFETEIAIMELEGNPGRVFADIYRDGSNDDALRFVGEIIYDLDTEAQELEERLEEVQVQLDSAYESIEYLQTELTQNLERLDTLEAQLAIELEKEG